MRACVCVCAHACVCGWQEYQTALLLDSENPLLLYSLGRAYAGLGMDKVAVAVGVGVRGCAPAWGVCWWVGRCARARD